MCQVRRRIYKGIPDSLRGHVWSLLLGIDRMKLEQVGVYEVSSILVIFMVTKQSTLTRCSDCLRCFDTVGYNNNNNAGMLEWPSPTRLFTLLSWYYFATFAMLIGVVSYSFLAS